MAPAPNMTLPPDKGVQACLVKPCLCPAHPKERSHPCHHPSQAKKGTTVPQASLPPVIQVSRDKSGHHRIQGHKVTEHTRLLCAQPSSVLFTSNIFLPQLTQHFHGQVLPSKQVQSLGEPSCKQQNKVSKIRPDTPRAEALGESYQPKHCALHQPPRHKPKHTCTAAGHSFVPPPHGFLHGHTSCCRITGEPGCLPQTNAHMPLFANPRVTQHQQPGSTPQQVLMHFCLFLAFNCSHGVLGSGWQPSVSVLSAHFSA